MWKEFFTHLLGWAAVGTLMIVVWFETLKIIVGAMSLR